MAAYDKDKTAEHTAFQEADCTGMVNLLCTKKLRNLYDSGISKQNAGQSACFINSRNGHMRKRVMSAMIFEKKTAAQWFDGTS